jgi:WD40 repeat protein
MQKNVLFVFYIFTVLSAGHKAAISCIEFHPYGEYLASGSLDTCIKLWDTRRKAVLCIRNDFLIQIPLFKTSRTRIRPINKKENEELQPVLRIPIRDG